MTPRHLADLDELILSCRDNKARALIQEAHACYRAGAYRSTVIATWVAVVYDLIEKLRELALSGDSNAVTEIASLDKAHADDDKNKMQSFENQLLEKCDIMFGFFHPIERKNLDRIFADRNRAAHPSHIRPGEPFEVPAELARLHIRTAVEIVLSQPATIGRAAIAALNQLAASSSLPATRGRIREVLEIGALSKPRASLFNLFMQQMVKQIVEPGLSKAERRKRIELIGAAFDMHPALGLELAKNSLRKMLSKALDGELVWVIAIVSSVKPIWDEIDEGLKVRMETFIENGEDHEVILIASDALCIDRLAAKIRGRIEKMGVIDLTTVVNSSGGSLDSSVLDRGLDLLKDAATYSDSWPRAAHVIGSILQRGAKEFSLPQLERLFHIVDEQEAKITPAWGFKDLVESLRENPAMADGKFEKAMEKRDWGKTFLPAKATVE